MCLRDACRVCMFCAFGIMCPAGQDSGGLKEGRSSVALVLY